MKATPALAARFDDLFGFAPPAALVRANIVDPRDGAIFLPPLAVIAGAPNAFDAVLSRAAADDELWPLLQLLTATFELTPDRDGAFFVHVPSSGDRAHVVTWSYGEGFSPAVATDADVFLAVEKALGSWQRGNPAPGLAAIAAARKVVDWTAWPVSEWVGAFTEAAGKGARLGRLPSLGKGASRAGELVARSRWVAELLVRGKLRRMRGPSADERAEKRSPKGGDYLPDALYWMWRSYFLSEDAVLERALRSAERSRSRIVRDARRSILALRAGGKLDAAQNRLLGARDAYAKQVRASAGAGGRAGGGPSKVKLGKPSATQDGDWSSDSAPKAVLAAELDWCACGPARLCLGLRLAANGDGYEVVAGDAKGVHAVKPKLVAQVFPWAFSWNGKRAFVIVKGALWEIDLAAGAARKLAGGGLDDAVAATPRGAAVSAKGKVTIYDCPPGKPARAESTITFGEGELAGAFEDGRVIAYKRATVVNPGEEALVVVAVDGAKTWLLGIVDPARGATSTVHREHRRAFVENGSDSFLLVGLDAAIAGARKAHPDGDGVDLAGPLPARLIR